MAANLIPSPWASFPAWWAFDGTVLATRKPPTREVVTALLSEDKDGGALRLVMALTAPEDRPRIVQMVLEKGRDGPDTDWFAVVADRLVERLLGWRRWEASYVWTQTLGMWRVIDGEHLARGVDLMELPVGRATSVVFAWWRQAMARSSDDWKQWVRKMEREPLRVIEEKAAEPMSADDLAQWQALMGRAGRMAG